PTVHVKTRQLDPGLVRLRKKIAAADETQRRVVDEPVTTILNLFAEKVPSLRGSPAERGNLVFEPAGTRSMHPDARVGAAHCKTGHVDQRDESECHSREVAPTSVRRTVQKQKRRRPFGTAPFPRTHS